MSVNQLGQSVVIHTPTRRARYTSMKLVPGAGDRYLWGPLCVAKTGLPLAAMFWRAMNGGYDAYRVFLAKG